MIHPERIEHLNSKPPRTGRHVLYWMQASQRASWNHALELAIEQANQRGVPLLAAFALTEAYPEANARHYAFMLEGLSETQAALARRGVRLVVRRGEPAEVVAALAEGAALVVTDAGYTAVQKQWRRAAAAAVACRMTQVETDVIVPVAVASDHREYAARTIRPKLRRHLDACLQPLAERTLRRDSLDLAVEGLDLADPAAVLAGLNVDRSVGPVTSHYRGGPAEAQRRLRAFVAGDLKRYHTHRGDPGVDVQSHLSPYLHFGQISPLQIALEVRDSGRRGVPEEAREVFLEELIVRRELCINYVHTTPNCASWRALPAWARATLEARRTDRRPAVYTTRQLEAAETADPYWNAAMREMVHTGIMHNTLRMYWGKKVLEWTRSPAAAFRRLLAMDNRWFLDGRDPLSYANVAWCFGLHDRPWAPRPIFGTVRTMTAAGLERKYDMAAYIRRIDAMVNGRREAP
ncbi:MAG: deoxyribodipyrimidine photolyase [Planctomycetes bacterium]|nr:deoxyribodipyrimidine photolyase [Planctomycetota bacterium]